MNLQYWREKIDEVDDALVMLLNRRALYVQEIAKFKQHTGLPIHLPEREAEVLSRVCSLNPGPLDSDALERLFACIIAESRRLEHQIVKPSETGTQTNLDH